MGNNNLTDEISPMIRRKHNNQMKVYLRAIRLSKRIRHLDIAQVLQLTPHGLRYKIENNTWFPDELVKLSELIDEPMEKIMLLANNKYKYEGVVEPNYDAVTEDDGN